MSLIAKAEEWRKTSGGCDVSSEGRVRYSATLLERKYFLSSVGYWTVNLGGINLKVHRLVAEAFLPNPESKRTVNHKNGIKTDNRLENLEWATHAENMAHAYRTGLAKTFAGLPGEKNPRAILNIQQVRSVFVSTRSRRAIAEELGVSIGTINFIKQRRNWKNITADLTAPKS